METELIETVVVFANPNSSRLVPLRGDFTFSDNSSTNSSYLNNQINLTCHSESDPYFNIFERGAAYGIASFLDVNCPNDLHGKEPIFVFPQEDMPNNSGVCLECALKDKKIVELQDKKNSLDRLLIDLNRKIKKDKLLNETKLKEANRALLICEEDKKEQDQIIREKTKNIEVEKRNKEDIYAALKRLEEKMDASQEESRISLYESDARIAELRVGNEFRIAELRLELRSENEERIAELRVRNEFRIAELRSELRSENEERIAELRVKNESRRTEERLENQVRFAALSNEIERLNGENGPLIREVARLNENMDGLKFMFERRWPVD